jgi:hypothetical protein
LSTGKRAVETARRRLIRRIFRKLSLGTARSDLLGLESEGVHIDVGYHSSNSSGLVPA